MSNPLLRALEVIADALAAPGNRQLQEQAIRNAAEATSAGSTRNVWAWAWHDFVVSWPTLTPAEADRRCICPLEWMDVED